MSVIKFELKEEHVKLLKHLRWSKSKELIVNISDDEDSVPFGFDTIYEAIDTILNGKPEEFDPFEIHDVIEYSDEQKAGWDKLYDDLPTALDVILHNQSFDLGYYKTKYHDRNWKKMN